MKSQLMVARLLPAAVVAALLALCLAGCGPRPAPEAAADGERRFPLTGEVLSVAAESRTARVQHDEIAGLMPAMTMDFPVEEVDLAMLQPGHRIRATLVVSGDTFRLEQVWPDDAAARRTVAAATAALQQDTVIRGAKAYREVGEQMPDFALLDQDGRVVEIGRFRGRPVVLNFIYSRCPIPTMCPAATARMVALQKAARAAGIADLQLVSVTLDPQHDTPGVLRAYAASHGIDTANFALLTGPEAAIRALLTQMGVVAEFAGPLIKHSLGTVLIDPHGKIVWREDGSAWDPAVFVARMKGGRADEH